MFDRYKWKQFRKKFISLRGASLLDYQKYRSLETQGGIFQFTGSMESITDGHTLWVRGENCTIPVSLEKTKCFLLPKHSLAAGASNEAGDFPDPPVQIRWNHISTLNEGAKIFIGGQVKSHNDRMSFVSTKENPLVVIFYDCDDEDLTGELVLAARTRGEYWNTVTPVSLVTGAMALVYIAASLLNRPAYRVAVVSSVIAVFIPVLPIFPPGLLFTVLYRRITWHARKLRAYRDLANIGLMDNPVSFALRAYVLEALGWAVLITGIFINVGFIILILSLLGSW